MPELIRTFCVCGNEIDDTELQDTCSICHGSHFYTYDPSSRPSRLSHKKTKAHDSTCECDACESGQSLTELDFGDVT